MRFVQQKSFMSVATRTGNVFLRTETANGKVDIKKACIPKKKKLEQQQKNIHIKKYVEGSFYLRKLHVKRLHHFYRTARTCSGRREIYSRELQGCIS